jgi:hypothetical protein
MFQNESREKNQQEESGVLHQRPQRPAKRRGLSSFLLFLGGMVIGVVVVLVAFQVISHAGSHGTTPQGPTTTTNNTTPTTPSKGASSLPGEGDPPVYWETIKAQVAQGLHMRVADLTVALKLPTPTTKSAPPPAGTTIGEIASQQGVSTSQLRTIEIQAIQQACNALVSQHDLSQADGTQRMQTISSWDQESLDGYIMYAFQNH